MKRNWNLAAACLVSLALLTACHDTVQPDPTGAKSVDPGVSHGTDVSGGDVSQEKEQKPAYQPTPEELKCYALTWEYTYYGEQETVYRLILGEDRTAQMVVQDPVGQLLDLYGGTWKLSGKEELALDLTQTMEDGEQLDEKDQRNLSGTYGAFLGDDASLTLSCENGAPQLVPGQEFEPTTFYDERFDPETLNLLCRAVTNYYRAKNGEDYPGVAPVH